MSSHAPQDGVPDKLPDGRRDLAQPARVDLLLRNLGARGLVVRVDSAVNDEAPEAIADGPVALDEELRRQRAGEVLALERQGEAGRSQLDRARPREARETNVGVPRWLERARVFEAGLRPVARDLRLADEKVLAAGLDQDRAREPPYTRHQSISSSFASRRSSPAGMTRLRPGVCPSMALPSQVYLFVYPRGVTMNPSKTNVWLDPTRTVVSMPISKSRKWSRSVSHVCWSFRYALFTRATGVVPGRWRAMMSCASTIWRVR